MIGICANVMYFMTYFRDTFSWHIFLWHTTAHFFLCLGFSIKLMCMCLFLNMSRPFRLLCTACQYRGVGYLFFFHQVFRQFERILTTSLVDDNFFWVISIYNCKILNHIIVIHTSISIARVVYCLRNIVCVIFMDSTRGCTLIS